MPEWYPQTPWELATGAPLQYSWEPTPGMDWRQTLYRLQRGLPIGEELILPKTWYYTPGEREIDLYQPTERMRGELPPVTATPEEQYYAQTAAGLEEARQKMMALVPIATEQWGMGMPPALNYPWEVFGGGAPKAHYANIEGNVLDPWDSYTWLQNEWAQRSTPSYMQSAGGPQFYNVEDWGARDLQERMMGTEQLLAETLYAPVRQQMGRAFDVGAEWAPGSENVPGQRRTEAQQAQYMEQLQNVLNWQPPNIVGRSDVGYTEASKAWDQWKPVLEEFLAPGARQYVNEPVQGIMGRGLASQPYRQRTWMPRQPGGSMTYTPRWG